MARRKSKDHTGQGFFLREGETDAGDRIKRKKKEAVVSEKNPDYFDPCNSGRCHSCPREVFVNATMKVEICKHECHKAHNP